MTVQERIDLSTYIASLKPKGVAKSVVGEGSVAFANTLVAASGQQVRLLNAAVGDSSLTPVQSANWLATGPDSLYGKMLAAVAASGFEPDAIIWIQGERLRHLNPDERTTAALFKKALALQPSGATWLQSTPGMAVSKMKLDQVLERLKGRELVLLEEGGQHQE